AAVAFIAFVRSPRHRRCRCRAVYTPYRGAAGESADHATACLIHCGRTLETCATRSRRKKSMPDSNETELIVLGAGPGGYAAAFLAADKGMQVTMIDTLERPGGSCLYVGCIPSKALLHAAQLITDARDAGPWGIHFPSPKIDIDALRAQEVKIVE